MSFASQVRSLAFSMLIVGPLAAQDAGGLPGSAAPIQALARYSDGKVIVKRLTYRLESVMAVDPATKEKSVATYVYKNVVAESQVAPDELLAYDVAGNPVPQRQLRDRLKDEIPVLASSDGKIVDPRHLRLHRADTIVLVLGNDAPAAPGVPPAGPPSAAGHMFPCAPAPAPPAYPYVNPPPVIDRIDATLKQRSKIVVDKRSELALVVTAPVEAKTGDLVPLQFTVVNLGSKSIGVTLHVELTDQLDEGSGHKSSTLKQKIELAPGQVQTDRTLTLTAKKPGEAKITASMIANDLVTVPEEIVVTIAERKSVELPPPALGAGLFPPAPPIVRGGPPLPMRSKLLLADNGKLAMVVTTPVAVTAGDLVPVKLLLVNVGNKDVSGAAVRVDLPAQLESDSGAKTLTLQNRVNLGVGETYQVVSLVVTATKAGEAKIVASVAADDVASASEEVIVTVAEKKPPEPPR